MISFVIYDDKEEILNRFEKVVINLMNKENQEYRIEKFSKYTKKFESIISDNTKNKIYIMDIEIPGSISGIDVAKRIRRSDWDSSIILVTSYVEMGYEALKAKIMLLDFISKFNDCNKNLTNTLKLALKKINDKKILVYESNGITYRLFTDDILYVVRDSVERKSIITTTYNEFSIPDTIPEILNKLDSRFYMSHRSCIVNTSMIKSVDWRNNIINFKGGKSTDYIARDKKKGLKEYVKSN